MLASRVVGVALAPEEPVPAPVGNSDLRRTLNLESVIPWKRYCMAMTNILMSAYSPLTSKFRLVLRTSAVDVLSAGPTSTRVTYNCLSLAILPMNGNHRSCSLFGQSISAGRWAGRDGLDTTATRADTAGECIKSRIRIPVITRRIAAMPAESSSAPDLCRVRAWENSSVMSAGVVGRHESGMCQRKGTGAETTSGVRNAVASTPLPC